MKNYVVIDLEMCKTYQSIMNQKTNYKQELIQIGAIALNENYEIVSTFSTFVSPEFGKIDSYIKNLTGISEKDTKNAPCAKEALELFTSWLPKNATIIAWSKNDEKQIRNEFHRKHFKIPNLCETFGSWIDCQQMFSAKIKNNKKYKLSEALAIANIYYDYGAHDALVDAKNTALLFAKMQLNENFELSPYFMKENDQNYLLNSASSHYASYESYCTC